MLPFCSSLIPIKGYSGKPPHTRPALYTGCHWAGAARHLLPIVGFGHWLTGVFIEAKGHPSYPLNESYTHPGRPIRTGCGPIRLLRGQICPLPGHTIRPPTTGQTKPPCLGRIWAAPYESNLPLACQRIPCPTINHDRSPLPPAGTPLKEAHH